MKQQVITVFTDGDSSELSTWSNVPYFLTKTLENKGFIVHRVNVGVHPKISLFFNKFITKLIKLIYNKKSEYYFNRTILYEYIVQKKMKKAVKKYKDTNLFISTSFSFTPWKYTEAKKVLFCDWTIDYYYKYFLNREPDRLEQLSINRQNKHIENSNLVISLFPNVTDFMKEKYEQQKNIHYLGNVINSELTLNKEEVLNCKKNSNSILFIGGLKYLEGAKCLIRAFKIIKRVYPSLNLNIIGISKDHFDSLPEGVNCYGYMDKSNPMDNDLYYSLIRDGKVIVNTTPKWAAFSATVEAMYWFTPVITTPYNSFIETFGKQIEFGYYCEKNDFNMLSDYILGIFRLDNDNYLKLCKESNRVVQKFTWDNYVNNILNTIEKI